MSLSTVPAQRTLLVLLLVAIAVIAGVASVLSFLRVPASSSMLRDTFTQPNLLLSCPAHTYVANHLCVVNCPPGFEPVAYDADRGPICMSPGNWPVSVHDLAGSWVSGDRGATIYYIVETVPLAKLPSTTQTYPIGVWLAVSQVILDAMPTVPRIPTTTALVATVGDNVGTFMIRQIGENFVQGVFYNPWPICCRGVNMIITIGDNVGISCEGVSIILEAINSSLEIAVFQRTLTTHGGCPVCLSGDTTIDTPNGPVNVKDVTVGMPVWTVDRFGRRTTGTVLEVRKSLVPAVHEVVHVTLQDGRQLNASPAHPTADGRTFGELMSGGILDNSVITLANPVPYNQAYTYDLLPSGDTGFYWANSILVGSTLS